MKNSESSISILNEIDESAYQQDISSIYVSELRITLTQNKPLNLRPKIKICRPSQEADNKIYSKGLNKKKNSTNGKVDAMIYQLQTSSINHFCIRQNQYEKTALILLK
jgi:hypothetical protein